MEHFQNNRIADYHPREDVRNLIRKVHIFTPFDHQAQNWEPQSAPCKWLLATKFMPTWNNNTWNTHEMDNAWAKELLTDCKHLYSSIRFNRFLNNILANNTPTRRLNQLSIKENLSDKIDFSTLKYWTVGFWVTHNQTSWAELGLSQDQGS